jgi:hypothetical protein
MSAPKTLASVTIADGASLSEALALGERSVGAIEVGASWSTAVLSLAVSRDGSTFVPLYDRDGEVTFPAASSLGFVVDPTLLLGWTHVKARSGTAASPVAQSGAVSVGFGIREFA